MFKLTPGSALLALGGVVGVAGNTGLLGELFAFCGPASVMVGGLGTALGGGVGVGCATGATLAEFDGAAKLDVDGGSCTCGAVSQ